MQNLFDDVRVDAEPVSILREPGVPVAELISRHSRSTDLTLIGMQNPPAGAAEAYGERLDALIRGTGTVLMVLNAQTGKGLLEGES